MCGKAESLECLASYRVLLAPLRFGAGVKGKVTDAWWHGTPVCTTPVGAEGMFALDCDPIQAGARVDPGTPWGGFHGAVSEDQLAEDTARLYADEAVWSASVREGARILEARFSEAVGLRFVEEVLRISNDPRSTSALREDNPTGAVLWHSQFRSTEYFSKWLELKEAPGQGP
eukprot:scaffold2835_cov374-Prasinococcus_capsulatus_cf.AAC.2